MKPRRKQKSPSNLYLHIDIDTLIRWQSRPSGWKLVFLWYDHCFKCVGEALWSRMIAKMIFQLLLSKLFEGKKLLYLSFESVPWSFCKTDTLQLQFWSFLYQLALLLWEFKLYYPDSSFFARIRFWFFQNLKDFQPSKNFTKSNKNIFQE